MLRSSSEDNACTAFWLLVMKMDIIRRDEKVTFITQMQIFEAELIFALESLEAIYKAV